MKGISAVIGVLLMLIITIALFGFGYTYISGVFTAKTSSSFSVLDSFQDEVTILNDGEVGISELTSVKVDGEDAEYIVYTQDSSLVAYWKM